MGRRFHRGPVRPEPPEHRVNHRIRIPEIRVIAPDGEALGVMSPEEGRAEAQRHSMDLVEVAPNAHPPVCRILDYGKFKYERSKAQKKPNGSSVKTVQIRPRTDTHDLETKLGRARSFLERGDKVKLVMRMRGRERSFPQRWVEAMGDHFDEHLADVGQIASRPTQQGHLVSMMVEPA